MRVFGAIFPKIFAKIHTAATNSRVGGIFFVQNSGIFKLPEFDRHISRKNTQNSGVVDKKRLFKI